MQTDRNRDTNSEVQHDETTITTDKELRQRGTQIPEQPHRDPVIVRYLRHDKSLTIREAAAMIEDLFGYSCTKSMVHRTIDKYDIRDPVTDGPFADILGSDGDDTEPAQPPAFFINRSENSPPHPFDTDVHSQNVPTKGEGRAERDEKSLTTPHFPLQSNPDSPPTDTDSPDSDSDCGTEVLKPPIVPDRDSDCLPSNYRVEKANREASLVAPPWAVKSADYPDIYKACGCRDCERKHFLDGDEEGPIDCPTPVPVTVAGARQIYRKAEGGAYARELEGNDVQRGIQMYARIAKADSMVFRSPKDAEDADRYCTDSYPEWKTTVLVSCRVSPTDDEGRLVTPYTLVQDVKAAWQEARDKLPEDDRLAYVWTFAGTDEWATIHAHWYGWYSDPEDELSTESFREAVETFCEMSRYAEESAHFETTDDGVGDLEPHSPPLKDGTVRIEHDPLLVDPERLGNRVDTTEAGVFSDVISEDSTGPERVTEGRFVQSRGAIYVATQLPRLALRAAERDSDVEFAAFLDVASDGRHINHGGGYFYEFADTLDPYIKAKRDTDGGYGAMSD